MKRSGREKLRIQNVLEIRKSQTGESAKTDLNAGSKGSALESGIAEIVSGVDVDGTPDPSADWFFGSRTREDLLEEGLTIEPDVP